MQDKIILQPKKTKKYEILENDGTPTGEYLEIDIEMVEYPLILQEALNRHYKNVEWFKNQMVIINKQKDFKRKHHMLTNNEEAKVKAIEEYLKKDAQALDLTFGKGTTKKMLNGRRPYYRMFDDIWKSLNAIIPSMNDYVENITNEIKSEYGIKKEEGILDED
jgi:hypothetical protein